MVVVVLLMIVVVVIVMQVVVTDYQRVLILYWIHSLTHILTPTFSSIRASNTLHIHLTLSTDHLSTALLANGFLANISKKKISILDAFFTRQYHFSAQTGHKGTLQYEDSTQKYYLATSTQDNTSTCTSGLWYKQMTRFPLPNWHFS